MYSVDLHQVRVLLAEAVKVKGENHKETSCKYVLFEDEDGNTTPPAFGCIVGTAVASLIGLNPLADIIRADFEAMNSAFVGDALPAFGITATLSAENYLRHAQDAQDGNHRDDGYRATWGEAIVYAESFL